jgi:hypothetical protein
LPLSINRLADSSLVVFDSRGNVTRLSEGGEYLGSFSLPFSRIDGSTYLRDTKVVVFGLLPLGNPNMPLLHIVDVAEAAIERSFFNLPEFGDPVVRNLMAYASADVRGDTIIAAFGGLDSVFVYTVEGQRVRSFGVPVQNFRYAQPVPPEDFGDPVRRGGWRRADGGQGTVKSTTAAVWRVGCRVSIA